MMLSTRDRIVEPFKDFKAKPFPHKVSKGFVVTYDTMLTPQQAGEYMKAHGYKVLRENDRAVQYIKAVGRFDVAVIFTKKDSGMLLAAQRR